MSIWSGRPAHLSVPLVWSGRLAGTHVLTVEEAEVQRWENRLELVLHSLKTGPGEELWTHQGSGCRVRLWTLPCPLLYSDLADHTGGRQEQGLSKVERYSVPKSWGHSSVQGAHLACTRFWVPARHWKEKPHRMSIGCDGTCTSYHLEC